MSFFENSHYVMLPHRQGRQGGGEGYACCQSLFYLNFKMAMFCNFGGEPKPHLLFQQGLNQIGPGWMHSEKLAFRDSNDLKGECLGCYFPMFNQLFSLSPLHSFTGGQTYILCTGPHVLQSIFFQSGQRLRTNSYSADTINLLLPLQKRWWENLECPKSFP